MLLDHLGVKDNTFIGLQDDAIHNVERILLSHTSGFSLYPSRS
jgi:hypothetical protein